MCVAINEDKGISSNAIDFNDNQTYDERQSVPSDEDDNSDNKSAKSETDTDDNTSQSDTRLESSNNTDINKNVSENTKLKLEDNRQAIDLCDYAKNNIEKSEIATDENTSQADTRLERSNDTKNNFSENTTLNIDNSRHAIDLPDSVINNIEKATDENLRQVKHYLETSINNEPATADNNRQAVIPLVLKTKQFVVRQRLKQYKKWLEYLTNRKNILRLGSIIAGFSFVQSFRKSLLTTKRIQLIFGQVKGYNGHLDVNTTAIYSTIRNIPEQNSSLLANPALIQTMTFRLERNILDRNGNLLLTNTGYQQNMFVGYQRNNLDQNSSPFIAKTGYTHTMIVRLQRSISNLKNFETNTVFTQDLLIGFRSYNYKQSGLSIIFGSEEPIWNSETQNKAMRDNFDYKMSRETEFFLYLGLICSKSDSNLITLEMLREAARLAGPDISVQFEQRGDVLRYVVLFPDDCRLFLHIPTLRGSFIHIKELLYREQYERIDPNINVRNNLNEANLEYTNVLAPRTNQQ